METLLAPAPRRSELARVVALAWLVSFALLLGGAGRPRASELLVLAAWAAALAAPAVAAAQATSGASFARRLGALEVACCGGTSLLLAASRNDTSAREELVDAAALLGFTCVAGLVLHAPFALLLRSMRARGAGRHRGREALVTGAVGALALAWLTANARRALVEPGGCACEGLAMAPTAAVALYAGTASLLAAFTAHSLVTGWRWEARLRPFVRAALDGALPGWSAVAVGGYAPAGRRLALDLASPWVQLAPTHTAAEADPYRATEVQAPAAVFVPARVRRVGSTQIVHALLLAAVVGLCGALAHTAVEAARLPHQHLGP
ncbi:MAG: hypothetical protein U0324_20290 [Polyangiales bacterium]